MSIRRRRRGERGAAAVEFALVMPIMLLLLMGIIDFGYLINRSSMVTNAARDAAREGSLNYDVTAIKQAANYSLDGIPGTTVNVACKRPDGTACPTATIGDGSNYVEVSVIYKHQMITPISMFFGNSIDINRSARMRIEPQ